MTKEKYLLCPGPMPSVDGNSTDQVSYMQLIAKYGVSANECKIYKNGEDLFGDFDDDLLLLIPRRHPEDYKLSNCTTTLELKDSGFLKSRSPSR